MLTVSFSCFQTVKSDLLLANIWTSQIKDTICDDASIEQKLCTEEQLGSFILVPNATERALNPIISDTIHLKDPVNIDYPIKKTGFYCVSTFAFSGHDYQAIVEFRNAYGELPAAQIAKLPFYGGLTIVYAVIGLYAPFFFAPEYLRHLFNMHAGSGHSYTCRIVTTSVR